MSLKVIGFLLVSLALPSYVAAKTGGLLSGSLIIDSNDNIGNAAFEADKREDVISHLQVAYKGKLLTQSSFAWIYGANIGRSMHQDFDLLDATSLELEFGFIYKPTNSFSAPTYRVEVDLGAVDAEIITRDVYYSRISLGLSKNITDKVSLRSGFEVYSQKTKQENIFDPVRGRFFANIFDLDRNRFFANLDYTLSRRSILYLTYSYMTGDVISVADDDLSNPRPEFVPFRDRRIHDEAFGPRGESRLYAYRLDADTNIVNVGYNIGLGRKGALDFSYRYVDSNAENGIRYETNRFSAAYLQRF